MLVAGFATSAAAEPLAVRDALVIGLEHNYDLKVAELDVAQAEAGVMAQQSYNFV